jgi:signal recognition particle receptor subunit beta
VQFNADKREITLKVVYYGPPLSGKTTNLQTIHKLVHPDAAGHLTILDTSDDRTLFFDLLPVMASTDAGYHIKLKLFTVPGQVLHAATRRVVLSGADGVVFVADSQKKHARANNEYWHGMRRYLQANGIDPSTIPIVIQFNKRDMPDVRTAAEIEQIRRRGQEAVYEAVAIRGDGVVETLFGLVRTIFDELNERYDFENRFQISAEEFLAKVFRERATPTPEPPRPGRET